MRRSLKLHSEGIARLKSKLKSDSTTNYWEVLGPQVSHNTNDYDDSHLTFKVQIAAFKHSIKTDSIFSKIDDKIEVERAANDFNRYVTGNFKNYKRALRKQEKILQQGYHKSFVAAYLNGYRLEMPVEEVLEMYYNHR